MYSYIIKCSRIKNGKLTGYYPEGVEVSHIFIDYPSNRFNSFGILKYSEKVCYICDESKSLKFYNKLIGEKEANLNSW